MSYYGWGPYVSASERRAQSVSEMAKLKKKGLVIQPVLIEGSKIAITFWGLKWCAHLEKYSDYSSRLPRGRTYVRNGSVCHLNIAKGAITAKVSGSEIYDVEIKIKALAPDKWKNIKQACAGQVGSLLELLQGKLSDQVMRQVTDQEKGLFPSPKEIDLDCSCPDGAYMCKHVAAVLYGIGARLDNNPEMLFHLRGVDHTELISADSAKAVIAGSGEGTSSRRTLAANQLADVFGIEVDGFTTPGPQQAGRNLTPAKIVASKNQKRSTNNSARMSKKKGSPKNGTPGRVR